MEESLNKDTTTSYEVTFITKNESDGVKVGELLRRYGASIFREREIQKIRFAYPIEKESYGFMGSFQFSLSPERLQDFSSELRLEKQVLRSMAHEVSRASSEEKNRISITHKRTEEFEKKPFVAREPKKSFLQTLTNEALEKTIKDILG